MTTTQTKKPAESGDRTYHGHDDRRQRSDSHDKRQWQRFMAAKQVSRGSQVLNGCSWSSMELAGVAWSSLELAGGEWSSLELAGHFFLN